MKYNRFFGNREFYHRLFAVMLPILAQNLITNFVNLLDNLMVGQIGTEQMSGVAIISSLLFVVNLSIFGGLSGSGILTAQYKGANDDEGIRYTMRAKAFISLGIVAAAVILFLAKGDALIRLFLHEGSAGLSIALTLQSAQEYLAVMLIGLLPFALSQVYSSTLREVGETVVPMNAGILAVLTNLVLNYLLIFGKFGFPELGVVGAAIATDISRVVECLILVVWTHRHSKEHCYVCGLYRSAYIPGELFGKIVHLSIPLFINELLWSSSMSMLTQCYSVRGLEVVSAANISSTTSSIFFASFLTMGSVTSIIIGQYLGAGELKRAEEDIGKLMTFTVLLCAAVGALMALGAPLIANIYNTTDDVKALAVKFLHTVAVILPVIGFNNCCYFTLRSGGQSWVTFLFDSGFNWVCCVPLAFCLSRFTDMDIVPMYALVQSVEVLKIGIGLTLLRQKKWLRNLVSKTA